MTSGRRKDVQSSGCVSKWGWGNECLTWTYNIPKATKNREVYGTKINAVRRTAVLANCSPPMRSKNELVNHVVRLEKNTFCTDEKGAQESALKSTNSKDLSLSFGHEKLPAKIGTNDVLPLTLKFLSVSVKYPLRTNLKGSTKKGNFSNSWENIWRNVIWSFLGYLNAHNNSNSTVQ